ncbi:hypothetical protein [Longimicrobium sp.]|uniref:hypothetical protein n=1 Tax=Longimicrobium sp. TaxID=2029185 RepID=UPI002F9496E4
MAAPNNPGLSRVRISTTSGGVFTNIGYVRDWGMDRGSEGGTVRKWLGGQALIAGDRTLSGDIGYDWDDGDTNGQSIAETAWANGSDVHLQVCPKGTAAGAKVFQFAAKIDSCPLTGAADGEAVEGTFGYTGDVTTLTTITLA